MTFYWKVKAQGSESEEKERWGNEMLSMCYHSGHQVTRSLSRKETQLINGQMCCSAHRIAPGSLQGKSYFRAVLSREKRRSDSSALYSPIFYCSCVAFSHCRKLTPLHFQSASLSPSLVRSEGWHFIQTWKLSCGYNTNWEKKKDTDKGIWEAHGVCVQHTIKGFYAREWCGLSMSWRRT